MEKYYIGEACISSVCYKEPGFMDYRYAACRAAEELGFHVTRNPEDTGITQSMFVSTLKQKHPVFILVVGEKESDVVKDECRLALDYGLPILVFLKTDGHSIAQETKAIMKSISQFTYDGDCALFSSCEQLYSSVRYRLSEYIKMKTSMHPSIQDNRGSTYYYAHEHILSAKKRIILAQKTSTLLLGPRKGNAYEQSFYETLLSWIGKKTPDMQFLHLFNIAETVKAFSCKDYDIPAARARLRQLFQREQEKPAASAYNNFTFRLIEAEDPSVSHIITDTGVQFVLPIAGNTFNLVLPYYFSPEDELMKLITHLNTKEYISYSDVDRLYDDAPTDPPEGG